MRLRRDLRPSDIRTKGQMEKAVPMPDITLIITNARVLTMDQDRPHAEAVAIAADRIQAVGSRAEVEPLAGPATRIIDAQGATVLPGFVESHMHLFGGVELNHLQLGGCRGLAELSAAFAPYAVHHPAAAMLMGEGVDYNLLDHPVSRHDLDSVMLDRPIAIRSRDHHTVWANTAALVASGLLHGAAMPHGHEVVMGQDGLATGELREFEAFDPVLALAGVARMYLGIATGAEPAIWPSDAERAVDKDHLARGMAHCARHGITTLVSMDGNHYTLALLTEMRSEGRLTQRVKVPFHFKPGMSLAALDRATAMQAEFDDDWISSGFVKLFMDGVIDSRTAAMLDDYPGHPGQRGDLLFSTDEFARVASEIDRRGLQIAVHAIGDAAVRNTIDGFAAAQAANGARDSRHRIEHIELIAADDIARLGPLCITASLQPPHAPGAMDFTLTGMQDLIERSRWPHAYLCKTLADQGAALAFASDWPVTDVSVLRGVQAAVTRLPYDGAGDERVGLTEALHAYTAGGAWAAHLDHVTGCLRAGMAADLVVLGGDIEQTPVTGIGALGIALTLCGGQITHQDSRFLT
jgi:predicted amidohydrolase YtcJ